jgi:hypothetical protein
MDHILVLNLLFSYNTEERRINNIQHDDYLTYFYLYIKEEHKLQGRIKGFLDFVHRLNSKKLEDKNTTFRKLDLFPSSGEGRHLLCLVP